jgi:hypothetical protein
VNEVGQSVRIGSQKKYNSGSLFILDIDKAPWGCGACSGAMRLRGPAELYSLHSQPYGLRGGPLGTIGLGCVYISRLRGVQWLT